MVVNRIVAWVNSVVTLVVLHILYRVSLIVPCTFGNLLVHILRAQPSVNSTKSTLVVDLVVHTVHCTGLSAL